MLFPTPPSGQLQQLELFEPLKKSRAFGFYLGSLQRNNSRVDRHKLSFMILQAPAIGKKGKTKNRSSLASSNITFTVGTLGKNQCQVWILVSLTIKRRNFKAKSSEQKSSDSWICANVERKTRKFKLPWKKTASQCW
jgi:hypothetical protein